MGRDFMPPTEPENFDGPPHSAMVEGAVAEEKVTVDLPRKVVDLVTRFGYTAKVRDGHDKSPDSIDVFNAIGRAELLDSGRYRLIITRRGAKRLIEWTREVQSEAHDILEVGACLLEAILELYDENKSSR
jgi:hypothetical protein